MLCPNPFQVGEVVEGGLWDGRGRDVETVERFGNGEPSGFEPVGGVGGIPGGDLSFDQGAQHFLRCPPLNLRGDHYFGGVASDSRQLQAAQRGVQIGGQVRDLSGWRRFRCTRCGGHEVTVASLMAVDAVG